MLSARRTPPHAEHRDECSAESAAQNLASQNLAWKDSASVAPPSAADALNQRQRALVIILSVLQSVLVSIPSASPLTARPSASAGAELAALSLLVPFARLPIRPKRLLTAATPLLIVLQQLPISLTQKIEHGIAHRANFWP